MAKIKRVFNNANEVAHIWANSDMSVNYKNSHNTISTRGNKFFSYNTVIAKRYKDKVIITRHSYSRTTDKHRIAVINAFRWDNIIYTLSEINYYELGDNGQNRGLYLDEQDLVIAKINALISKQSRDRRADYTNEIHNLYTNLVKLASLFEIKCDYVLPNISEASLEAKNKAKVIQEAVKSYTKEFQDIWDGYVLGWRLKDESKDLLVEYQKSLAGNSIKMLAFHEFRKDREKYALMRIDFEAGLVRTDRHANVTIQEAKLLLKAIELGDKCVGLKVGYYTVVKCDKKHIQVGCHDFLIEDNIDELRKINDVKEVA